eukprot:CAMPEP_0172605006 /NCGR_PEP_ID=MMETSP1068-20121228/25253_1 /TAXON_ID=35684 /ORGANISM="Pseudopedinella elastica, Strain CCMP716" /LENGTH=725 /DNA_ID=CAMNT_0013407267 /DNA_START=131 /DNA_END=2308 /DNA_ORIENTATION=+
MWTTAAFAFLAAARWSKAAEVFNLTVKLAELADARGARLISFEEFNIARTALLDWFVAYAAKDSLPPNASPATFHAAIQTPSGKTQVLRALVSAGGMSNSSAVTLLDDVLGAALVGQFLGPSKRATAVTNVTAAPETVPPPSAPIPKPPGAARRGRKRGQREAGSNKNITAEERLAQHKKFVNSRGRPKPSIAQAEGYVKALSALNGSQLSAAVHEMFEPTLNRSCHAKIPTAVANLSTTFRWAFLVQTGGNRKDLVSGQVAAFLAPFPRVVVSDQAKPLKFGGAQSPITMTWGGTFGQKILPGIQCVALALGSGASARYDFLAVLDDDSAVRPGRLDEVVRESGFDPNAPHLLGFDVRLDQPSARSCRRLNATGGCADDPEMDIAKLARKNELKVASEIAILRAIGEGHVHGGSGTVLSRGAVDLLTSAPVLRSPLPPARSRAAVGTGVQAAANATANATANGLLVGGDLAENEAVNDAYGGHRVEEGSELRALNDAYARRFGIAKLVSLCTRCLLCPWYGFRQRDREDEALAMEVALGFGNCSGSLYKIPCMPGDTAIAACLATLGVTPTRVANLSQAFNHMQKARGQAGKFTEQARHFAADPNFTPVTSTDSATGAVIPWNEVLWAALSERKAVARNASVVQEHAVKGTTPPSPQSLPSQQKLGAVNQVQMRAKMRRDSVGDSFTRQRIAVILQAKKEVEEASENPAVPDDKHSSAIEAVLL